MQIRLAHAKINLFLRIVRRREDGYHEIETVFQRIGLADELAFETGGPETGLDLVCRGIALDTRGIKDNLVARAYRALEAHRGKRLLGIRIVLEKNVPPGTGLGGGSSDAATTLVALNGLFGLGLNAETLRSIALSLGADVPFFLGPPAAIGRGVGERLTPLAHPAAFWVALALPDFGVSTAEVYRRYRPDQSSGHGDLNGLLGALQQGDLSSTLNLLYNELEPLAFSVEPSLGALREELERRAGRVVRMSGSGSALYTLAASKEEAQAIIGRWENLPSLRQVLAAPFAFFAD